MNINNPTEWYCMLTKKDCGNKFMIERYTDCPLIEVEEPKTGHWVDDEVDSFSKSFGYKKFHCSNCNSTFSGTHVEKTDYCPNCGAKMESEVEK
jgi:hypothetical protein